MHKVKCVWPMGHPPGPKEASTSGMFVTDTSHPSHPSVEAIHEVAEAIHAMSDQQAELGRQQAKNSRAILSMSQRALDAIDRLASAIMEEVRGISAKGGAQSGGVASGSDRLRALDLSAFDDDSIEGVETANEPSGDKDFWAEYGSGGEMMDC